MQRLKAWCFQSGATVADDRQPASQVQENVLEQILIRRVHAGDAEAFYPSQALERRELRDALTSALESLPEKYREILILRDVNQLSITETAQILRLSEANVKTRLSRARLQMRDALASGFGGLWNGRSCEKVQTS